MAFPLTEEEHNYIETRIQEIPELIVAAAVRVGDIIIFKERPGRHADAMNFCYRKQDEDGFVTSRGRFVDRQEAARIVKETKQGSAREWTGYEPALFSEDMWHNPTEEGAFASQNAKDQYNSALYSTDTGRTNTSGSCLGNAPRCSKLLGNS